MVWCSKQSIKQISIKNQVEKNRKQRDKENEFDYGSEM